jgi:branched-chain amino acid transport system permease protein
MQARSQLPALILSDKPSAIWVQLQTPAVLVIMLGLIALVSSHFGGSSQTLTEMMIRVVLVVGLYVFVGNSGILSFGHMSFMSIGAYAFVWLSCCTLPMLKPMNLRGLPAFLQHIALPSPVGLLGAAALAGAVAIVVGAILMRLSGTAASIATFAFLAGQYAFYMNWSGVTGGTALLSNLPVFVGPAVGTGLAVLTILVAWLHQESRYGFMLRAARDDQTAAKGSGVNVWFVRTVAFGLSGLIVGVGGAMHAGFLGIVTVDAFYLPLTFLTLAMLIVGGAGSLSGAVIGVVALTAVTEILRRFEAGIPVGNTVLSLPPGFQEVGLGLVMILVMMFRPAGIMGGRELTFGSLWPGRRLSQGVGYRRF